MVGLLFYCGLEGFFWGKDIWGEIVRSRKVSYVNILGESMLGRGNSKYKCFEECICSILRVVREDVGFLSYDKFSWI